MSIYLRVSFRVLSSWVHRVMSHTSRRHVSATSFHVSGPAGSRFVARPASLAPAEQAAPETIGVTVESPATVDLGSRELTSQLKWRRGRCTRIVCARPRDRRHSSWTLRRLTPTSRATSL